jgi:hypothetical protein
MAQDWDIKARGSACRACATAFKDQETYYAALVLGEGAYARADYCAACWPRALVDAAPYSRWKGVFRMPPPAPTEPLKRENAEALLRRLMEQEDEANRNPIFILAVMLERRKLLVERDVQRREDGILIRVYEHRKTGDTFIVPDPNLRLDQVEAVQKQVIALLEGPGGSGAGGSTEAAADKPAADGGGSSPAGDA